MSEFQNEWASNPKIFQINTWPWLDALSKIYEYPVNLQNIPEEVLDLDFSNFDAVWLMGVWERSPRGREIALTHPDLQGGYQKALSDFKSEDVVGSPYSIHYYNVDFHLGGRDGLVLFRDQLAELGVKLIVDYVPNHVAVDHLWTLENSGIFIKGSKDELEKLPNDYFLAENEIIAHGRDPNFYPWTDTAQINAFSSEARLKTFETLMSIAEISDGVRCDMAMLLTNEVFTRTWGEKAGAPPETEFWEEIIPTIKVKYPDFKFIAEVYWDMEWALMQQGFDFCYDKRLYDRLKNENAKSIKAHLQADMRYQRKLVRFIENHDEERAAKEFGIERSRAAAILSLTLPGARLIHEGQMSGYKKKLPVQLGRRENEEDNLELLEFYLRLINSIPGTKYSEGNWTICKVDPVGNFSNTNLIAFVWWINDSYLLTVVNYSAYPAQGNVIIEQINYGKNEWSFTDLLAQDVFIYEGENLETHGLFIDLPAWNGHIFDIKKAD